MVRSFVFHGIVARAAVVLPAIAYQCGSFIGAEIAQIGTGAAGTSRDLLYCHRHQLVPKVRSVPAGDSVVAI
ncbi:MAG: hypothetical protein ABI707_14335 [Ferruginibacter sp.]